MSDGGVLPPGFVERMRARLGRDAERFFAAMSDPPDGLRVNTLRIEPAAFEQISPVGLVPIPQLAEGYLITEGVGEAGKHPYHAAGLYYLQDPAAMVVGALVGAAPGERVLDLSAAPGGKASLLAARMQNRGLLVANDVARARAGELARNLERCGVTNALVTCERPERLAEHFGASFDRVLVDAPCSGESMFHKSPAARADWSPASVVGCARRQTEILSSARSLVAPGGVLVYSTCTFSDEENEGVAAQFLEENRDFEPCPLPPLPGGEPVELTETRSGTDERSPVAAGCLRSDQRDRPLATRSVPPEHPRDSSPDSEPGGVAHEPSEPDLPTAESAFGYRLWPHRVAGAGHFVVAFRRSARLSEPAEAARARTRGRWGVRPESIALLQEFVAATYPRLRLALDRIVETGEDLFQVPDGAPSVSGLCTVRSGLWLGSVRGGRFEPAHAFALAADPALAPYRVDLSLDDTRTEQYLAGHPIEDPGHPGWTPVCVDGFALGWGKRVGKTVKNHYPKGLRTRGR